MVHLGKAERWIGPGPRKNLFLETTAHWGECGRIKSPNATSRSVLFLSMGMVRMEDCITRAINHRRMRCTSLGPQSCPFLLFVSNPSAFLLHLSLLNFLLFTCVSMHSWSPPSWPRGVRGPTRVCLGASLPKGPSLCPRVSKGASANGVYLRAPSHLPNRPPPPFLRSTRLLLLSYLHSSPPRSHLGACPVEEAALATSRRTLSITRGDTTPHNRTQHATAARVGGGGLNRQGHVSSVSPCLLCLCWETAWVCENHVVVVVEVRARRNHPTTPHDTYDRCNEDETKDDVKVEHVVQHEGCRRMHTWKDGRPNRTTNGGTKPSSNLGNVDARCKRIDGTNESPTSFSCVVNVEGRGQEHHDDHMHLYLSRDNERRRAGPCPFRDRSSSEATTRETR